MEFPIEEFDAATLACIDAVIQKAKAEEREWCIERLNWPVEIPIEELPPGQTKREYGAVLARHYQAALRALPLDES